MSASGRYEKNGGTTCRKQYIIKQSIRIFSKLNLNMIIAFKIEQKKINLEFSKSLYQGMAILKMFV